ncbi:hypothetical protein JR316_0009215 [Psilocybe cubensis]|uniref:Uncharacterized protein n=2 Tax=Psilocybe cubensis TaxID=181762 RepID=A0A8H7XWK0_PSICU|nr:hypothetical protein JR316_0009215 [Psilocybe cubensis]KAH9478755.1 hypothetical protein JR316_0009215 [Psilocybe cubensis]
MPSFWSASLDLFRKDPSYRHFDNAMKCINLYNEKHDVEDLNTSISHFQISLRNRGKTKEKHARYSLDKILTHYSDALWTRYQLDVSKFAADMDKVIQLDEEICRIWGSQSDQPAISAPLAKKRLALANLHAARCYRAMRSFERSKQQADKDFAKASYGKAIGQIRTVLWEMDTVPPEVRWIARVMRGVVVTTWWDHQDLEGVENTQDAERTLQEAINNIADALDIGAPLTIDAVEQAKFKATPETCMRTLGTAHYVCYQISERLSDLDDAIRWNRQLLSRIGPIHEEYAYCKFDLAQQLFEKYQHERRTRKNGTGHYLEANTATPGSQALYDAEVVAKALMDELPKMHDTAKYREIQVNLDKLLRTMDAHSAYSASNKGSSLRTPSPAPSAPSSGHASMSCAGA